VSVGLLDELADASLLQALPGGRFQFHDLLRLFAAELWAVEDSSAERERASRALLAHVVGTASSAGLSFFPDAAADAVPSDVEAGEWLAREESNWIAAVRGAARSGLHREVLALATAMHWYSDRRRLGPPWLEIFSSGLAAARALGDRRAEAKLLNLVGWAWRFCLGDHEAALAAHRLALAVAVEAGDRLEEAWTLAYTAGTLNGQGRSEEALDHMRRACLVSEEFDFWSLRMPARNGLSRILRALGRHEEALSVCRELLADLEPHLGERSSRTRLRTKAFVTLGIGECLVGMGRWRAAAEAFHESRQLFADTASEVDAACVALDEGDAWLKAGERAFARECLQDALTTYGDSVPSDQRDRVRALRARLRGE
jgi:tetratricopeptide (TPR) repeat protein